MVLEKLGEAMTGVVRKISLAALVDERLVKEIVRDIQRALLSADVNVKLVMELSKKIERRALKEKPKPGLSRKEHTLAILYEELVNILGQGREWKPAPGKVMLVGLQGSGKTTTTVKLARFYTKYGLKPFIIAADTYRPAAYEQIMQLAEPLNIKVYGDPKANDPVEIIKKGLEKRKGDVVIIDTAGRHKSEKELFEEMKAIATLAKPDEKLLVIDSTIGQQAGAQAKAFSDAIGITGVILTKLDGSAKGGGALSAVAETSSPVMFVGTGEKIEDFEFFDPNRFMSRLLGMGDLASLMEKAREVEEEKVRDILKGEFTLVDLQSQIEAIRKMGPLGNLINMIPGMGMSIPKEAQRVTEEKMNKFLVIINSMTKEEKSKPKIIDSSRIRRIARGSGTRPEDVKELMNYYKMMKKAIKGFKKGAFGRRVPRGFEKMLKTLR
jgi:signal recognition particle subunit SRP54